MNAATLLEEMPALRQRLSPLSVKEYHRLGEYNVNGRRTELIRGIVIEKARKSPMHVYLHSTLCGMLHRAVGVDQRVRQHDPLTLSDSEPEPDLAVVAGDENRYRRHHPQTALMVMEITEAPEAIDRLKADLYAEAGIPECWLVLVEHGLIEAYQNPRDGRYTERRIFTAAEGDTLVSTAVPALRLDLAAFFAA